MIVDIKWLYERYALTGNSNPVFLLWKSGLELHVSLYLFFLLSMYFRIFLEKKSSNFSLRVTNLPF